MARSDVRPRDVPIVLALMKNPNGNESQITADLNKDNPEKKYVITTVHRRIKRLVELNVVLGAVANLNFDILEMDQHPFLLEVNDENRAENIKLLNEFFTAHPYTLFSNRVYGYKNGIYCIFSLPRGEKPFNLLKKSFDVFLKDGIITNYDYFGKIIQVARSVGDIRKMDLKSHLWNINFDEYFDKFDNPSHGIVKYEHQPSVLRKLIDLDMIILREYTRNARRMQIVIRDYIYNSGEYKDIIDKIHASVQTFSRRLKKLKERKLFSSFNLSYDRKKFGLFNQTLLMGDIDEKNLFHLVNIIDDKLNEKSNSDKFPFPTSISITEDRSKFIIWANIPPIELMDFVEMLCLNFKNVRVYYFERIMHRYFFYNRNFIKATRSWRIDTDWLYTEPMKVLDSFKKTEKK